jgi:hypothetical protein
MDKQQIAYRAYQAIALAKCWTHIGTKATQCAMGVQAEHVVSLLDTSSSLLSRRPITI